MKKVGRREEIFLGMSQGDQLTINSLQRIFLQPMRSCRNTAVGLNPEKDHQRQVCLEGQWGSLGFMGKPPLHVHPDKRRQSPLRGLIGELETFNRGREWGLWPHLCNKHLCSVLRR